MRYMTIDEFKRLLLAIPEVSGKGNEKRNQLMALVQFTHCLRISEVISLTGKHVRDEHIVIQRLKGSEKTVHPFFPDDDPVLDEATQLKAYLEENKIGLKDRLFPITRFGAYNLYLSAAKKAGIPAFKVSTHALKHTRNQQLIRTKKMALQELRTFNGHKSIASTGQYIKTTDEEAVAAVFTALGR